VALDAERVGVRAAHEDLVRRAGRRRERHRSGRRHTHALAVARAQPQRRRRAREHARAPRRARPAERDGVDAHGLDAEAERAVASLRADDAAEGERERLGAVAQAPDALAPVGRDRAQERPQRLVPRRGVVHRVARPRDHESVMRVGRGQLVGKAPVDDERRVDEGRRHRRKVVPLRVIFAQQQRDGRWGGHRYVRARQTHQTKVKVHAHTHTHTHTH
jgi:hypothetical protein